MAWRIRRIRLEMLGMTYEEYLRSDLWSQAKDRYRDSGLPRHCIVCHHPYYHLHHISYQRLGKELPGDLLPLCPEHHTSVHEYERLHPTQLESIHKILREITGWSRGRTGMVLEPFNAGMVKDGWRNPSSLTRKQRHRARMRGHL